MALFPHKIFHPKVVDNKGFTLTEIMVSVVIIVIIAGGLFGAFMGAQQFLNRSKHRMQAYNFAMDAIDKLRSNYAYSSSSAMNIGNGHLDIEIDPAGIIQGDMSGLGGTLNYDVTEPQANGYKQVTIKVHWDEPTF